MTREAAIEFLRTHQPMPSDFDITDEEANTYIQVMEYFAKHPDQESILLFLHSLSDRTGLGMDQHLGKVFCRFSREELAPHLITAMKSQNPGTRRWAVDYACDFPSEELTDILERMLQLEKDEDTIDLVKLAMEQIQARVRE